METQLKEKRKEFNEMHDMFVREVSNHFNTKENPVFFSEIKEILDYLEVFKSPLDKWKLTGIKKGRDVVAHIWSKDLYDDQSKIEYITIGIMYMRQILHDIGIKDVPTVKFCKCKEDVKDIPVKAEQVKAPAPKAKPKRKNHKWTWLQNDAIIRWSIQALEQNEEISIYTFSEAFGMSPKSVRMKISNYNYLLGEGGLSGASKVCKEILKSYHPPMVIKALKRIKKK